ncbi:MAG: CBS domain-containing protein [Bacillus sp. (in: Bacteria)]|nr:CBS domain-containing protein [Bacillus sp. (in: firmicutes)]
MYVVKDIMTKKVFTVYENDTVEECAKVMLENETSSIPVIDRAENLVGIVTEKDLIKRASRIKVPVALELLGGFIYLDSPKKVFGRSKAGHVAYCEGYDD